MTRRKPEKHDGHVQQRAAWATAYVAARSVEEGDCLIWQRAIGGTGVPSASIGGVRGLNVRRWLWESTRGQVTPGNRIVSRCGNQRCMACLAEMTPAEVGVWLSERGILTTPVAIAAHTRAARANGKYSMAQAREVRQLRAEGKTLKEVEAITGVPWSTVSKMARGTLWREAANGASVFGWRPAA